MSQLILVRIKFSLLLLFLNFVDLIKSSSDNEEGNRAKLRNIIKSVGIITCNSMKAVVLLASQTSCSLSVESEQTTVRLESI
jgi:hypothetical protein